MLKTLLIILFSFINLLYSDEILENNIYYFLPGPNLVSFNILPENTDIEEIFSSIEDNLVSIISEGQICHQIDNEWVGTLDNLGHEEGYWVVASDITLIDIEGYIEPPDIYFLDSGSNLISYPFSISQTITDALPFYMNQNLIAIIGENTAALFHNNQIYGSLTHFYPNKGYWFITTNPIPFEYNIPEEQSVIAGYNSTNDEDIFNNYNQSTMQSVFFVNQAFYNGNILNYNDNISVLCDNTIVGGRTWNGQMTDIIAMGYDGYGFTEGYCEQTQTITMQIENDEISSEMHIIGNQEWSNNNISIVSISNFQLGDINFDDNINVTDIIMLIEHIISSSIIDNDHQLLLSDINSDGNINVSDIVFIVDLIIE